jgi:pimeloyl-ACP methyl ester carboxylesterase
VKLVFAARRDSFRDSCGDCAGRNHDARLRDCSPFYRAAPYIGEPELARKFLYIFAGLIVLVIVAAFAYRVFGVQLLRQAMVPSAAFEAQPALAENSYKRREMWIARPDLPGNPALWTPEGIAPAKTPAAAAVFFIHPTSYLDRSRWNAPLDDKEANDRAALFLRGQASAFNGVGDIWAPRYRQATFGAFITDKAEAQQALDLAYRDVTQAFDEFLREAGDRPIILAGHSQGALHLSRLLHDRVAGTPLAQRVVAAYVVGWPISRTADLPALGLPECATADQPGCILSWQSFAAPADTTLIVDSFDAGNGLIGLPRKGSAMVCTNPITGTPNSEAPASANLGTIFPAAELKSAVLTPARVPASCQGRGFLMIGEGPDVGPYVLPGNNYHVFDYSLFWGNVRADAARRLTAFSARK